MVLSMTGFGRAEGVFEGKKLTVDIKSLNSKTFDLNIKVPIRYKEKEFDIRKLLNDKLLRGKVDCYINLENLEDSNDVNINKEIVKSYMTQLSEISPGANNVDYLQMAVRMPEAISNKSADLSDEEWNFLFNIGI